MRKNFIIWPLGDWLILRQPLAGREIARMLRQHLKDYKGNWVYQMKNKVWGETGNNLQKKILDLKEQNDNRKGSMMMELKIKYPPQNEIKSILNELFTVAGFW